jgi:tetratricopeptide (TPR) repeat protein
MSLAALARPRFALHTHPVHTRWIAAVTLAASTAQAQPAPRPGETSDGAFWDELIEPHRHELGRIIAAARRVFEPGAAHDGEPSVTRLRNAYGQLRYARKLAPEHPEVLMLLGATADELGRTREAIEALETCVRTRGAELAGPEVTGRLGGIALRLGKLDDAVRWLRFAQGPVAIPDHAVAAVHLASALAAQGAMADAIDVLANALPAGRVYLADSMTLIGLALAVQYDRDEQSGAAFAALNRLRITFQHELGASALRALALLPFAPAEDEYYYRALVYEFLGNHIEARAEWLLYAAGADAPWRSRALAHVTAMDAERSAAPPPAPRPPGAVP